MHPITSAGLGIAGTTLVFVLFGDPQPMTCTLELPKVKQQQFKPEFRPTPQSDRMWYAQGWHCREVGGECLD